MNEGTHNEYSRSMLLGYILVKVAATAREGDTANGDPFHGVFASVARREASALGIDQEIADVTIANLATRAEAIKDEISKKHSGDCGTLFQLGIGLSATTRRREPPTDDVKAQLLLLAVLCNLSDQVDGILAAPESDREKLIVELVVYVDKNPRVVTHGSKGRKPNGSGRSTASSVPDSLALFVQEHPLTDENCFIMMRFGDTDSHRRIAGTIEQTLAKCNILGLRADDRQYHDELYSNIVTYMHGCGIGIAVYERIETEAFNPNVSLEVGYMLALGKPVLLLKDRNLGVLQADLIGRLYHAFDPGNPEETIPPVIEKWLRDKGMIDSGR